MIIGLTGSLATGKTTVAGMLRKKGTYVIDADKIVHSILNKGVRRKLGRFVFDDAKALKKLCGIIHPVVKKEIFRLIAENRHKKIIVIEAPLLIESGLHKKCQVVIVVKANLETQIRRARKKWGITKSDCLKRIRQQMPLREKIAVADFVINNKGPINNTKKQVDKLWETLQLRKNRLRP